MEGRGVTTAFWDLTKFVLTTDKGFENMALTAILALFSVRCNLMISGALT